MKQPPAVTDPPLSPSRAVAVVRRVATPIWLSVGIAATLEIRGRVSGATRRVTVIPVELGDNLYAMAWGGVTDWARNLRAAGCGELRRRRRTQVVHAVEVDGDERDEATAAYMKKMGPFKRDFDRRPSPSDHPVFRLEPAAQEAC